VALNRTEVNENILDDVDDAVVFDLVADFERADRPVFVGVRRGRQRREEGGDEQGKEAEAGDH